MDDPTILSEADRIILITFTYLTAIFLILSLVNIIGGQRIRIIICKSKSILLYTSITNSNKFFFVSLLSLVYYIISNMVNEIIETINLYIYWITFILVFVATFIAVSKFFLKGGVLKLKDYGEMIRFNKKILSIILDLSLILFLAAAIYVMFIYSELGKKIISFTIKNMMILISFLLLPMFMINTFRVRKNIVRYILFGIKPKLNLEHPNFYRFCFVINSNPGEFSDLMNSPLIKYPSNRSIKTIVPPDLEDRIRAHTDYEEEIFPSNTYEITENMNSDQVIKSKDEWVLRLLDFFIEKYLSPYKLFLLDLADYHMLRSKWRGSISFERVFLSRLNSIYFVLDENTDMMNIDLFINMLNLKNILSANLLIENTKLIKTIEHKMNNIRNIKIINLENRVTKTIVNKILLNERSLLMSNIGDSNPLSELVELEIVRRKIDQTETLYQNNTNRKTLDEKINQITDAHYKGIELRNASFVDTLFDNIIWQKIPQSIAFLSYAAAKDLIRGIVNEKDFSTRIYIIFNIIEMLSKTLVLSRLSFLPVDHPDVIDFPYSISGTYGTGGNIADFADDVNYLYRFTKSINEDKVKMSEPNSILKYHLTKPIQISISEHIEKLQMFYPFIVDPQIKSLTELLVYSSFLRNQVRGHGVVTNFVSAIVYPILIEYLDKICSTVEELGLNLQKVEDNSVNIQIAGKSVSSRGFIQYNKDINDYIFLEGYRKGQPIYIAYSAGTKYKPAVLTGLNDS